MIRNCPMCQSSSSKTEITPDFDISSSSLASHWVGFLADKTFFPYHRCDCGFLFCPTYPDEETLGMLYGSMSDNEHSGNPNLEKATKTGYVKQFIKYSDQKHFHCFLEMGADNGSLAKVLNQFLTIDEYHCVEPNKMVHSQLKLIPNVIVHETLDEAIKTGKKFDAVIAVHVLDHVPNLDIMLVKLKDAMSFAGIFYAVVHNEQSLLARVFGKRWPAYCLQHPHLFNNLNLKNVLSDKFFGGVKVLRTKNYFSFGYLLKHFFLAVFRKEITLPDMFNLGIKLGNIALVGKRKDV